MRWQELTLRLALIVGLFAAVLYGINIWIAAPLGLLAIAATAELAIRPYSKSSADKLLLGCGTVVTILILAGIVLNLTPWGLTRASFTVTWTILSISVLGWRRNLRVGLTKPSRVGAVGFWIFSASLMFVLAVMLALGGVRQWNKQPVLAFALVSTNSSGVVVEIDSTSTVGSYRIMATSSARGAHPYSSGPITVRSPGSGSRILERVPVNMTGAWTINLESASDGTIIRWLKVNVG